MRPLSVVSSLASLLFVAGSLATMPARAEANIASTFPQKPIRMVVTFPAGGGTDSLARLIGTEISKSLGQPVVVDNRPGASGNIGAEFVAKSPADGYTLLIVNSSFAINPSVFKKLQFNPKSDFSAVITFASVPSVIAVPSHSKIRNFSDLMAAGKSGTPPSYASCGNGTPQHLAGELLKVSAKMDMLHVPYKGCAPAIADVLGNQADVSVNTLTNTIPYLKSNKLRALAVTSKARSPFLPDVPTVSELGVAGYDVDQWFGILAPANTPPEIVQKLNAEIARAVAKPEIKASLTQLGFATTTSTPAEFQKLVNSDIDRWQKFATKINLLVD
ncbi:MULTISPECIES: tripartite tricarboxylate transporter substrate binding protein [unclassified Cupriavidus]|uniref:tripartite tricarboxylate transporter substrate binding protein n=1 Tax=unclassified Cupriavidus TaxID=2640874 RepID=UPI001AE96723|nr:MULTISPECIES: tripartite tricarboxylate transporter substrate binding protein [unclassified Cupriavidus]MBP0629752.1 tripartite tricarboxylate transporter substrate binding protein [Cupriavidus sp. AcVe19-1a]MBP0636778.1 tripartite tricarboxylate transporter substrate binding protein [Cupriavidus sp. AcVe19-6a]